MNKDFKIWMAAALCTACLCACNEEENIPTGGGKGAPIGFTAGINGSMTREYSSQNLPETMGVFAYLTTGNFADHTENAIPNYMQNTKLTKKPTSSAWDYTPTLYWPNNTDYKLSFFAYAPFAETVNGGTITLPGVMQNGFPQFTFTLPTDDKSVVTDLLVASLMDQTYNGSTVKFTLKHALAKLSFVIKNADSDGTAKTITGLSIKSCQSGTLTYSTNNISWTTTDATNSQRTYNLITSPLELPAPNAAATEAVSTLAIPDNTGATLSCTYKMTIAGEEQTYTLTDIALPTTPVWTPGSNITYVIWLKREDEATITTLNSSEWTNAGNNDEIITIENP